MEKENKYGVLTPHNGEGTYEVETFSTLREAYDFQKRQNFGNIIRFIYKVELKEV
jgi:hypothetical protein